MAGYIGKAKSLAVLAEQDPSIPSQTGNSGKYLTTDGTDASWATVEALPDAIDVNASAPADSLVIDASGRVGVNTTSPSDFLINVVRGSGMGTEPTWESTSNRNIALFETDQSEGYLVIGAPASGFSQLSFADAGNKGAGGIGYNHSNDELRLRTNGSNQLLIDSAGRVTMPYQPAFRAYLSSSYSHPAGTQLIPFDQTSFNIGNHYNTSTHRFTAPITGLYQLSAVMCVSNGQAISYWGCRFRVNGSTDYSLGWNSQSAGYQREDFVTLIYLTANDYVEARHEMQSAATIDPGFGYTHFTGYLIG